MSRLLRAGTAAGPAADVERAAPRGFHFQDLPSGLASLVIHFAVLIVLGLVVTETSRPHLTEVIVDWDQGADELAGGGGGTDGTEDVLEPAKLDSAFTQSEDNLAQAVPEPEPLLSDTAIASEWGDVTADLVPALTSTDASDALADMATMGEVGARGLGSGGGRGGGHGKGTGPGTGDGIGPGSETGVFGLRDEGARIVYVFDRSESMNSVFTLTKGDNRNVSVTFLEAAKTELTKSVKELADGGEFQMIFYNDMPLPFPDHYQANGLSRANADTKERAQQFIYQLVAERNTNHIDALIMGLELKPDVIFLMTDGEAKDDPTSSDLRQLQKLARRSGTRINVVHFVFENRTNSSLESLAKRTQGKYKQIHIRSLIDPKW